MSSPSFVYTTHIASTPEAVWKALTSSEFTQQYWSGNAIESDWRIGSPIVERNPGLSSTSAPSAPTSSP